MIKGNYHTHSYWCKHAVGTFEDYVRAAEEAGFEELAITDHCPHRYSWCWLHENEVAEFDEELNRAIAAHKDKIRLFKGFECEYIKEEMEYYKYLKEELGYTFLILGQHCAGEHGEVNCFDMKNGYEMRKYADSVCAGLETGEFMLLAHPDVVFTKYPVLWDADCDKAFAQIFKTCEKLKIPVEINTNGLRGDRGYPSRECMTFSKDYDLKYLIGSDCHDPRHMHDEWENRAVSWAKEIGIAVEELYPWKDRLQTG